MEHPPPPVPSPIPSASSARTRRISTLLVCDLVNSTRLVERLGDRRAADLIQQHDQLARNLLKQHRGREIDKTDGFLLEFERPSHALAWALMYHAALARLSRSEAVELRARVGIHMGDVVSWENPPEAVAAGAKPVEIEGLAKPTAARLAQLALPGQTLLSESAATLARRATDEIDTPGTELVWLQHGRYRLKGLPEPVAVTEAGCKGVAPLHAPASAGAGSRVGRARVWVAVALVVVVLLGVAGGVWYLQRPAEPVIPEKSVAVLPFANDGGNRADRYFSDGLSEDLINALSQFAQLKVISRHSAFQFRDSKDSAAQIGRALGVRHLLEGSVQRKGDEVRVTATLVNTADGSIAWSHLYDQPYTDLFALQDAITRDAARALQTRLALAPGAVLQSDRPPSGNLDAYAAYQHGVADVAQGTAASFHRAIDAFTQATRIDPHYAAAYARLAGASAALATEFLSGEEERQANSDAWNASDTALSLDPDSSLAHQIRAQLLQTVELDFAGAEAEAKQALRLAPNDPSAQLGLALALAPMGHNRRAAALTRQALSSDPRHGSWYYWLANCLAASGELDAAQHAVARVIALQPGAAFYHYQLATIEVARGDAEAALAAAHAEPPGQWHDIAMALALQIGTDHVAADAALKQLVAHYASNSAYQIAEVYALRRDPDGVFQWLQRAWSIRDPGIGYLLSDPFILRYRSDPRFAAFCKQVGLPTTTDAVAMK